MREREGKIKVVRVFSCVLIKKKNDETHLHTPTKKEKQQHLLRKTIHAVTFKYDEKKEKSKRNLCKLSIIIIN